MRRVLLFGSGTELWEQVQRTLASRPELDVSAARSLQQVMAELAAFAPHLILADVDAPGLSRLGILDQLARRPGSPPVAILTAVDSAQLAVRALRQGAVDYVVLTPGTLARLPERLGALLDAARPPSAEASARTAGRHDAHFLDSPEMMHVVDHQGRIVDANRAELEALGYSHGEYVGRPFLDVVRPDCRQTVHEAFGAVVRGKPVQSLETTLVTKDGHPMDVEITAFPETAGSHVVVVRAIMRNITARKHDEHRRERRHQQQLQTQRELTARSQAELERVAAELVTKTRLATLGQLSASIAHDLRNPLGSIRNAAFYLKRHLGAEHARIRPFLDLIDEEVQKADEIITNLLGFARAKEPVKGPVDLRKLVECAFAQSRHGPGVECNMQGIPERYVVWADHSQFRQVLLNMIQNALEAMGEKGELAVEASRDEDYDTIVFRDTGPGVLPAIRHRLFDPLATGRAEGIGLGLAICRQIVEAHGGTIDLLEGEQAGAAFRIRLPREPQGQDG
ncbi:MAG TPA: PAS domain S-box protein [Planctomycetaceae bacterium]|nr:PAS domain S-box protein [Planctomycetaceae bacterium]